MPKHVLSDTKITQIPLKILRSVKIVHGLYTAPRSLPCKKLSELVEHV